MDIWAGFLLFLLNLWPPQKLSYFPPAFHEIYSDLLYGVLLPIYVTLLNSLLCMGKGWWEKARERYRETKQERGKQR